MGVLQQAVAEFEPELTTLFEQSRAEAHHCPFPFGGSPPPRASPLGGGNVCFQALTARGYTTEYVGVEQFRGGQAVPANSPDPMLPEIISSIFDGELEYVIEKIYYDIYSVLPRTECQTRLEQARLKLQRLHDE